MQYLEAQIMSRIIISIYFEILIEIQVHKRF